MKGKQKTQAMPGPIARDGSAKVATTGLNPGRAGPKGALAESPSGGPPSSGPPTNEGNNTRRDFVRGPAKGSKE
jgi:hypothetical protein